jgi:predicted AAA+ superfamily ATPase
MPFTLGELKGAGVVATELDEALFRGGYPVLYDREIAPTDYFPSYIQTYIERDVRSIANIGDLSTFQRFIKLCAGRVGQLLNMSSLGNDLGINYKTVQSWISILETSFIVFRLPPHHRNFRKRLVKQHKLYFYDTGLLCSLLDIESPRQISTHYLRGNIFESMVISEYLKQRHHSGQRSNAYFWRDNKGHEVDLLLEHADQLTAVEIKSAETLNPEAFRGLRYFKSLSGIPEDNLLLIYGGARKQSRKYGQALSWRRVGDLATN